MYDLNADDISAARRILYSRDIPQKCREAIDGGLLTTYSGEVYVASGSGTEYKTYMEGILSIAFMTRWWNSVRTARNGESA